MVKKMKRVFLVAVAFLFLLSSGFAGEIYWLRGNTSDIAVQMDTEYTLSTTAPDSSAAMADFSLNTTADTPRDWAIWQSGEMAQNYGISGTVYLWFSSMSISGDSGQYRWTLWDYSESDGTLTFIVQSGWLNIPANSSVESSAAITTPYTVQAGSRIGLWLEYKADNGDGDLNMVVDKPVNGTSTSWVASSGNTYTAIDIGSAAAVLLNSTACTPACSSNSDCDDGNPTTTDSCQNAGSCEASCSNTPKGCVIGCFYNTDCDDNNPVTTDTCNSPGTCDASCSHACTIACHSNSDCDDGNPLTLDNCSQPGTCTSHCSSTNCNPRCTSNSECDDQDAATTDVCAGAGRCGAVCINMLNCGNGDCEQGETECSCPSDCGTCSGTTFLECREFACSGNSCKNVIQLSCCGNDKCEINEDYGSCSKDCEPKNIAIELIDYDEGEYWVRGEEIQLKASVEGDDIKIISAKVTAKGFFGEIELYNDGRHNDGTSTDNIYGNSIVLRENAKKGSYNIEIEASFLGKKGILMKRLVIDPILDITLNTDRGQYSVGDLISISGAVNRKSRGLALPLDLNIIHNGKVLFEEMLDPAETGIFSASYHSSLLDPSGSWVISASASDENGNTGFVQKEIDFASPEFTEFLEMEFPNAQKQVYRRGDEFEITVSVKRGSGETVEGSQVKTIIFDTQAVKFTETGNGIYTYAGTIGWDARLGVHRYEVIAMKSDNGANYGGNAFTEFDIEAAEYLVEVLEPVEKRYMIGEEAKFRVKLVYPDSEPVLGATINALVNGKPIEMTAIGNGVYTGSYVLQENDFGKIMFTIESTDQHSNNGAAGIKLEVAGTSLIHYLREYAVPIALVLLAVIMATGLSALWIGRKKRIGELKKNEARLVKMLKEVQKQYFKEALINRATYDKMMNKYESEIKEIRKSIELLEKKKKVEK